MFKIEPPKSKELILLTSMQARDMLTSEQRKRLTLLTAQYQLQQMFAPYVAHLTDAKIFWNFNYYDMHHESLIDVIILTDEAVHLLKLNHYSGLHYLNANGMLADYFTDKVKMDHVELSCVKYSMRQLIPRNMPIYMLSVCLNASFELDVHASKQDFLFKNDIALYMREIKQSAVNVGEIVTLLKQLNYYPPVFAGKVKQGVRCTSCNQIGKFQTHHGLARCTKCGHISSMDMLLIEACNEFQLFYPEYKITCSSLYEFCAGLIPKHRISAFLKNHFTPQGETKGRYYLDLNMP